MAVNAANAVAAVVRVDAPAVAVVDAPAVAADEVAIEGRGVAGGKS